MTTLFLVYFQRVYEQFMKPRYPILASLPFSVTRDRCETGIDPWRIREAARKWSYVLSYRELKLTGAIHNYHLLYHHTLVVSFKAFRR